MKNIRKFETVADYEAWMSGDAVYPNVCYVAEDGRIAYNPPPPPPLYIEALEDLTVNFSNEYEWSKDNITWYYHGTTGYSSISASKGERVFFRASGLTANSSKGIGAFDLRKGHCNIGGNIMSMVYGADFDGKTEITQDYQFYKLFYSDFGYNANIKDASALILPATTLTTSCYYKMFDSCTSLEKAPILPATTLASNCYQYMFNGCTSLVNAPELPATTLASYCYSNMFNGCTSLVNAPELPATTLANSCYGAMFEGCTSLVNAPELPATTLASYCYQRMFEGCTSLVNAPTLPATTLIEYCYYCMFLNCTSLSYIKMMALSKSESYCTRFWVKGVASSGTFVKNSEATWNDTGENGVPSGWTVELADA